MISLALTLALTFSSAPEPDFLKHNGYKTVWPRAALPLWLDIRPSVEPWRIYIKEEASAWNTRLKRFIFLILLEPDKLRETGSVIRICSVSGGMPHTKLWFSKDGHILMGMIFLPLLYDAYIQQRVIAHELGHILGLNHDPELPESLMYPTAIRERWIVTPHDIEALQDKYRLIVHGTYKYNCN